MNNKKELIDKIKSLVQHGEIITGALEATSTHNGVDYMLPVHIYCSTKLAALTNQTAIEQESYFPDHQIGVSVVGIKEEPVYDQYVLEIMLFWYIPDSEELQCYKTVAGLSVLSEATERQLDELETKIWGSVKKRFRQFPRLIHRGQDAGDH